MPTFRSPRNPNFKLWSHNLQITFQDGSYTTDDQVEIRALRRHVRPGQLVEVSIDDSTDAFVNDEITLSELEEDVEAVLGGEEDVEEQNDDVATDDEFDGLSRREMVEYAESLEIEVPRNAGKKVIAGLIREARTTAFDPNDPDGS